MSASNFYVKQEYGDDGTSNYGTYYGENFTMAAERPMATPCGAQRRICGKVGGITKKRRKRKSQNDATQPMYSAECDTFSNMAESYYENMTPAAGNLENQAMTSGNMQYEHTNSIEMEGFENQQFVPTDQDMCTSTISGDQSGNLQYQQTQTGGTHELMTSPLQWSSTGEQHSYTEQTGPTQKKPKKFPKESNSEVTTSMLYGQFDEFHQSQQQKIQQQQQTRTSKKARRKCHTTNQNSNSQQSHDYSKCGEENIMQPYQPDVDRSGETTTAKQVPANTEKMSLWAARNWFSWAEEQNASASIDRQVDVGDNFQSTTADQLNYWLCRFIVEVRNRGGQRYPAKTVNTLCANLQRYVAENCQRPDLRFLDKTCDAFAEFRRKLGAIRELARLEKSVFEATAGGDDGRKQRKKQMQS
ncbi:uncharacterized protein LOC141909739 isoform X2 [Tubulanus polymorphus]